MRRTHSDNALACDSDQLICESTGASRLSFTHSKTSPKARWRWALDMIKRMAKGSSRRHTGVMLLPEHWLEARHPMHRSHLKPYFQYWKNSDTRQAFFFWLDKGEGKDIDLPERPRAELEATQVRYCPMPELALLEVCVQGGLLKYNIGKRLVHTPVVNDDERQRSSATSGPPGEAPCKNKWIYVLDLHNRMFINKKQAGEFHHTSFTCGGPVRSAGSIVVHHGEIQQITAWSGHYRPTEEDFTEVIEYLDSRGIDMSKVDKFLTKKKEGSKMAQKKSRKEREDDMRRSLFRVSAPPPSLRDQAATAQENGGSAPADVLRRRTREDSAQEAGPKPPQTPPAASAVAGTPPAALEEAEVVSGTLNLLNLTSVPAVVPLAEPKSPSVCHSNGRRISVHNGALMGSTMSALTDPPIIRQNSRRLMPDMYEYRGVSGELCEFEYVASPSPHSSSRGADLLGQLQ